MGKRVDYHRGFQHGRTDAVEENPRQPREPGKDYAEGYASGYKQGRIDSLTQQVVTSRPKSLTAQEVRDEWTRAILKRRRK